MSATADGGVTDVLCANSPQFPITPTMEEKTVQLFLFYSAYCSWLEGLVLPVVVSLVSDFSQLSSSV